jgi:hypothetical protein
MGFPAEADHAVAAAATLNVDPGSVEEHAAKLAVADARRAYPGCVAGRGLENQ